MSTTTARSTSTRAVLAGVLLVSVLLAGVVSFYAASTPDGLTKVSQDQGFAETETDHAAAEGPFAGYASSFVDDDRLGGGLAGVVGVLGVLALGSGIALVLRRRGATASTREDTAAENAGTPETSENIGGR